LTPPYNTDGDFVYNDKFKMSAKESELSEGTRDVEGNPLQKNSKSSNRYHANWLNMIYPRLKLAKDLLTDDGAIFVSIDEHEHSNLISVMNEIFGEDNYIDSIIWDKKASAKGVPPKNMMVNVHEYLVAYQKIDNFKFLGEERTEESGGFKNPDNDPRGPWRESNIKSTTKPIEDAFTIVDPKTGKEYTNTWAFSKDSLQRMINENRILWKETLPKQKEFMLEMTNENKAIKSNWGVFDAQSTTVYLKNLVPEARFDNPKPINLMKYLISVVAGPNDTILDFFSGSATTGDATMQLNAEDGGRRNFILVQLPEKIEEDTEAYNSGYKTICDIGKERLRRAGEKIKIDIETTNAQLKIGEEDKKVPDIGFKVFRTSDTNIKWNLYDDLGQIDTNAMTHTPDLADFTMGYNDIDVVYEVMLRQKDVPLSSTLETLSHIGSRTYLYGSAYLICLETDITEELIDKLAALDPLPIKFVFRDSAFKDDINLKDETFRRLKNLIERNAGLEKKSYTVEFI
jgi:adenine-specific DNA-methyltransferase